MRPSRLSRLATCASWVSSETSSLLRAVTAMRQDDHGAHDAQHGQASRSPSGSTRSSPEVPVVRAPWPASPPRAGSGVAPRSPPQPRDWSSASR
jgi:hypothetical protein